MTNNFPRVTGGFLHSGTGHRRDRITGLYPVYPLPRWSVYENYTRHPRGSGLDILHYMMFAQDSYQTVSEDITGSEIANIMCGLYNTDPERELRSLATDKDWDQVYDHIRHRHEQEFIATMSK